MSGHQDAVALGERVDVAGVVAGTGGARATAVQQQHRGAGSRFGDEDLPAGDGDGVFGEVAVMLMLLSGW